MERQPLLTKDQLKRVANILDNLGQVIVASVVVPSIFGVSLDSTDPKLVALIGLVATFWVWWVSLEVERISP